MKQLVVWRQQKRHVKPRRKVLPVLQRGPKKAGGAVTGSSNNVQAYTRRFVCPSAKGKEGTTNVTVYMKKKGDGTYEFRTGDNNPVLKDDGKLNPAAVIRCPSQLVSAKVSIENPKSTGEYSPLIKAIETPKQFKSHLDRVWQIAEPITSSPTPPGEQPTTPRQKLQAEGFKRFKFPCKNIFGSNKLFRVTPDKIECSRNYTIDSSSGEIKTPTKAQVTTICYRRGDGKHCTSENPISCTGPTNDTKCPSMMTDTDNIPHNSNCFIENPLGSGNWVRPKTLDKTKVYTGQCRRSSKEDKGGFPACGKGGKCHHHEYDSGAWLKTTVGEGFWPGGKVNVKLRIQAHYRRIIYSQAESDYADAATALTCNTSLTQEERDRYERQKTRALDILNMDLKDYATKYGNQPIINEGEEPGSIKVDGNCFSAKKRMAMTKLLGEIGQTCFRQLPSGQDRWPMFPFKGDTTLMAVTRDGANQDPNDTDEASKECNFFGNCSFADSDGNWRRMSSSDYQRDDSMVESAWKDWLMGYPDMRDYTMLDRKGKRTNIVKGHCTNAAIRAFSLKEGKSADSKAKKTLTRIEKQSDAKKEKEQKQQQSQGTSQGTSQGKKKSSSWFSSRSDSGDSIGSSKIKGQLKEAAGILIEVLRSSDNSEQFSSVVERLNKIARGGSVESIRHALSPIVLDVLHLLHQTPRSHLHKRDVKRLIHQFYQIEKTLA